MQQRDQISSIITVIQNAMIMSVDGGSKAMAHCIIPIHVYQSKYFKQQLKTILSFRLDVPVKARIGNWFSDSEMGLMDIIIYKHDWVFELFKDCFYRIDPFSTDLDKEEKNCAMAQQVLGFLFGYAVDKITPVYLISTPPISYCRYTPEFIEGVDPFEIAE
jgi:hypothetical protein